MGVLTFIVLSFESCENGVMYWDSDNPYYGKGSLNLERLVTISGNGCEAQAPEDAFSGNVIAGTSGSWFDTSHDGEGWVIQVMSPQTALMFWFSYTPEGQQAWFFAPGTVDGDRMVFDMLMPSGTFFGDAFNASAVSYPDWGQVTMEFEDCSSGTISYESTIPGYGSGKLNTTHLTRLSGLTCP